MTARTATKTPWPGQSAADFVATQLREDIIEGRIEPGDALVISRLAERFGVSAIPVREALRLLNAEGFVTLRAHHPAVVADFAPYDVGDAYDIRMLLEGEAIRKAAGKLTADTVADAFRTIDEMQAALEAKDYPLSMALHREVHLNLYRPGASPMLLELIANLLAKTERYSHAPILLERDPPSQFADEHRQLTHLLASADPEEAEAELKRHLERARAAMSDPAV